MSEEQPKRKYSRSYKSRNLKVSLGLKASLAVYNDIKANPNEWGDAVRASIRNIYSSSIPTGTENELSINTGDATDADLLRIVDFLKAAKSPKSAVFLAILDVRKNRSAVLPRELFALPDAFDGFFAELSNGWVFSGDGDAWAYAGAQYHEETEHNSAFVSVSFRRSSPLNSGMSLSIRYSDLSGLSVPKFLADHGLLVESAQLMSQYRRQEKTFQEWFAMDGSQFETTRELVVREEGYRTAGLSSPSNAKVVINEGEKRRTVSNRSDTISDVEMEIPVDFRLMCFDLTLHVGRWIHVNDLKPYKFDTKLSEKLVLPEVHKSLIDVLMSDLDVLSEDIIKGKNGSTIITCAGAPGLGKTLTAEVYSECCEKPLYKISAAQLGLDAEDIEKNLTEVLDRAARWKCITLVDEADVFIRSRDNDTAHNAIVAALLRVLEYSRGVIFLTTNRSNDIDDAILSRSAAVIKYEPPNEKTSEHLWRVLSKQLGVRLNDQMITELVARFPKLSGRDTKQLLNLAKRYHAVKNVPLSMQTFNDVAQFRNL